MIFFCKILQVCEKRKEPEPEPQFVISALAPRGNLISAPRLSAPAPQNRKKRTRNVLVNISGTLVEISTFNKTNKPANATVFIVDTLIL
jgi:hypothetical protein